MDQEPKEVQTGVSLHLGGIARCPSCQPRREGVPLSQASGCLGAGRCLHVLLGRTQPGLGPHSHPIHAWAQCLLWVLFAQSPLTCLPHGDPGSGTPGMRAPCVTLQLLWHHLHARRVGWGETSCKGVPSPCIWSEWAVPGSNQLNKEGGPRVEDESSLPKVAACAQQGSFPGRQCNMNKLQSRQRWPLDMSLWQGRQVCVRGGELPTHCPPALSLCCSGGRCMGL